MERLELMDQVVSCEACELHAQCTAPAFMALPQTASAAFQQAAGMQPRIAVLGEAPGEQEDKAGRPFVGPAGKMLRGHLQGAGIDPDSISYVNTVSCWPHGTPTWDHVVACSKNREDQLAFSGATHVLVVGKVAMKAIEPALEMKHGRARPILKHGRLYYVTYHPAAALRNGNYEDAMADDIRTFTELVKQGSDWLDFVRPTCSACPKDMYWMQESGLTWCLEHVPHEDFEKAQQVYERNRQAYLTARANLTTPTSDIDANAVGKAQTNGMDTSKKAALNIFPKSGTQRRKVYDAIAAAPDGLTDDEMCAATGLSNDSARPRRAELKDGGWVYDSGKKRASDDGAEMTVWMAKAGG